MDKFNPLISVVVPMYNGGETIENCLTSITGQTIGNIEIVVVDDGSTDRSPEISESLAASDRRIRVIRQHNSGPTGARRTGVENTRGEWVCFVDSDDILTSRALEHLYGLTDEKTDIVISTGDEWELKNLTIFTPCQYCESLLNFRLWPMWGRLYRRYLLDNWAMGLSKDFVVAEDFLTNLRILSNLTGHIVVTPQKVYGYNRGNPFSLQHRFVPDYNYEVGIIKAAEETIERFLKSGDNDKTHESLTVRDSFVKWRLRYLAGMTGLGYKVDRDQPWIQRLLEDCRETRLNVVERLALLSLGYNTAKIFFRLEKNVKSIVRTVINLSHNSSSCHP